MLSIGDLAHQTGVSKRTLRHWDAVGLLTPSHVDPRTSYRWYAPSQTGRVHAIVALRTVGFGLDEIADLLAADLTAERLLDLLRTRESELATQIESASASLAEVRRRRRSIERGLEMTATTLQLQPLPALRLARVMTRVTDEAEIGGVVAGLAVDLRKRIGETGHGEESALICTYYGPPGGGPIEVAAAVEVPPDQPGIAGVELTEVPAEERGVSVRHTGGPGGIGDAWVALDAALEPYGLTTSGVYRQLNPVGDDGPIILQAPVVPLTGCS